MIAVIGNVIAGLGVVSLFTATLAADTSPRSSRLVAWWPPSCRASRDRLRVDELTLAEPSRCG